MISLPPSTEREILFDQRSIATIEFFHSTPLSDGNEVMPKTHAEMNEEIDSDQNDEGITIHSGPRRVRSEITVLTVEKDQRANDRMPRAQNDQDNDRDDRVHVDYRQIGDRWLEREKENEPR